MNEYLMRCMRCSHVHDVGAVKVIQRYMDCTVWACPGCGSHIDDRPRAWGGFAVHVTSDDEFHVDPATGHLVHWRWL